MDRMDRIGYRGSRGVEKEGRRKSMEWSCGDTLQLELYDGHTGGSTLK